MANTTKIIRRTPKKSLDGTDPRFEGVRFSGTFREYQQRVIHNISKHLSNEKIHIVAAPGSGKTILGLELIRMLGKPALILSPTIAIRDQWKERFEEMFLPKNEEINRYVSCSLTKPALLTSITYQGLYTSWRRLSSVVKEPPAEEDDAENAVQENYSTLDIVEWMKEQKISVLCLDEAHHLRAEWQKALYEFVEKVEHTVSVISLTATPPYDSKKSEWDKYITMCGPIDEEIFVPELVRAKNLCPHQDFIYYNFPTPAEIGMIETYKANAGQTLKDIVTDGKYAGIVTQSAFYKDPMEYWDELEDRQELIKALLAFLEESNLQPPRLLYSVLERGNRKTEWNLETAQFLFQSMISDDVLFAQKDRETVKNHLSRHGLMEKGQVGLVSNIELEKLLISSAGKLSSIAAIAEEETKNLGDNIRLLVLTDYIRVHSKVLGSETELNEMGVIPIFELLRRKNLGIKLAVLSGKMVIVPNETLDEINELSKRDGTKYRVIPLAGTQHSELRFEGNRSGQKVALITRAFNAGIVNGIVGTKSLLGEGWDSPVINTLILASCVGSFMLSNQMRGRAIRVDKNVPEKVSNIWHLTALMPEYLQSDESGTVLPSADYAALERRFKSFLGLSYYSDSIESTLTRAATLKAPFSEKNVRKANEESFELAADREQTKLRWDKALDSSANEVIIQNEIPKPKRGFIPSLILKPSHFGTVKKVTNAVMKTFKELKLIGKKAKAVMEKDYKSKTVNVGIVRCSQVEKSMFHQAMGEVLSPFDCPKYALIKNRNGKLDHRAAFAVPEIFSKNKQSAEVFQGRMSRRIAQFDCISSRSADGKKHIALAKKKAYVNKTDNEIQAKMKLRQK